MKKSFSYRLYPNKKQEVHLNRTLGTCRYTYNNALAERIRQSTLNKLNKSFDVNPWGLPEWISYYDQASNIKTSYQEELHSQVYQNVLKRVERSFQNMFKGAGW
jgi:putative transposase